MLKDFLKYICKSCGIPIGLGGNLLYRVYKHTLQISV